MADKKIPIASPQPAASLAAAPGGSPAPAKPKKGKKRFLRWLIPTVAVVVVAGVVTTVLLVHRASATETTPEITTRDVQASMVTMTQTVSASGTIEPQQEANLSFSSSGTVTAVNVAVGDKVTAGQALASIDTTDLQASVDSAQAAVDAAQSDYDTAVAGGVDAKITAANSTLATKQNALTNAESALAAGTLTAPFDGTVASVTLAVGDSAGSGGSGGSSGGSIGGTSSSSSSGITVISTNLYSVTTSVGASDVTKISKGMDVAVTPNGASAALQGTVTSVGVIASSSSASGATFPVSVNITDPQDGLYAGVTATMTITTSSREVLAVPTAAISTTPNGSTVELKNADGSTTTTTVTTGESSNSMTEITDGLNQGDTVVVTVRTGGNANNQPGAFSSFFAGNGGNRPQGNFTPPAGFSGQGGQGFGGQGFSGQGGNGTGTTGGR